MYNFGILSWYVTILSMLNTLLDIKNILIWYLPPISGRNFNFSPQNTVFLKCKNENVDIM